MPHYPAQLRLPAKGRAIKGLSNTHRAPEGVTPKSKDAQCTSCSRYREEIVICYPRYKSFVILMNIIVIVIILAFIYRIELKTAFRRY